MGFKAHFKLKQIIGLNAYEGICGAHVTVELMDIGTISSHYWTVIEKRIRRGMSRQKKKR